MTEAAVKPDVLAPLDPFLPDAISATRLRQLIWGLVILGLFARLVRFLLRFPLWPDEAAQACSLLDRDYWGLTGALEMSQMCPLLQLWGQYTCVQIFGFNEYSLRLLPFLFGIAAVFLFWHLARRLLTGVALALAVGTFACAYPMIRYTNDAKPYGGDLFVALGLMSLAIEWYRLPERSRWLWALTAATPVAMWLASPTPFVAGAISLFVAWVLWRKGTLRGWLAWLAYNIVVVASFASVLLGRTSLQAHNVDWALHHFWAHTFPPLAEPDKLLSWLLRTHTRVIFDYPVRNGSWLMLPCGLVAVAIWWRRRQYAILLLSLSPLALMFVAAALHRYPFGGHVRFALFFGMIVCLWAGLGGAALLEWLRRRWRPDSPAVGPLLALAALALVPIGTIARDLVRPYKMPNYQRNRDFARWFWADKGCDAELACLKNDLGLVFCTRVYASEMTTLYYCNQRIYFARLAAGRPLDLSRVSARRPLRCVELRSPHSGPYDEARFQSWLDDMLTRYELVARERHPLPFHDWRTEPAYIEYVEVYDFVPRKPP
jgi:hypothetical protein